MKFLNNLFKKEKVEVLLKEKEELYKNSDILVKDVCESIGHILEYNITGFATFDVAIRNTEHISWADEVQIDDLCITSQYDSNGYTLLIKDVKSKTVIATGGIQPWQVEPKVDSNYVLFFDEQSAAAEFTKTLLTDLKEKVRVRKEEIDKEREFQKEKEKMEKRNELEERYSKKLA